MQRRLRLCLGAAFAAYVLFSAAAHAQISPFRGSGSRGLSPEDNQVLFESVGRLNAAEPSRVGLSESWTNPQTGSSGSSTILRTFHSGGMACHLVRHHIVAAGHPPGINYRLTWCRTPSGEWKIKS